MRRFTAAHLIKIPLSASVFAVTLGVDACKPLTASFMPDLSSGSVEVVVSLDKDARGARNGVRWLRGTGRVLP